MEKKLSVIVPCYNEEKFIDAVLNKIVGVSLDETIKKEVIIIDDASTDRTLQLIKNFKKNSSSFDIKILHHSINKGKGACIITGIHECTGNYILIQDADLEYDPKEYPKLLQPVLEGHADVVYTSRTKGAEPRRVMFFYHTLGVSFLTFLSNLFTRLNLTDIHSGHKLFKAEILKTLRLKEQRFGFDTEITAKISRIKGVRIYEVGIAYYGRRYDEGKKFGGLMA